MELRLENNGNISVIYLDKINLVLGSNKSGKTQKLNKLNEIFSGNSDYALVNGVEVNNGLYNVVYIKDNRDIDAEVEIKAKSAFHMNVIKPLVNNNYELLNQYLNDFSNGVSSILETNNKLEYRYSLSNSEVRVNSKKMEKLETLLFEIYAEDKHSMSSKEEFYFYQALSNLKDGINNILLIDDIDRYLDSKVLITFFEYLNERTDTTIIMASKNKYLLYELGITKYINKHFNTVELLPLAKRAMFESYRELEKSNVTLDSYVLQSESFYSENDYNKFLETNYLEILKKINI